MGAGALKGRFTRELSLSLSTSLPSVVVGTRLSIDSNTMKIEDSMRFNEVRVHSPSAVSRVETSNRIAIL